METLSARIGRAIVKMEKTQVAISSSAAAMPDGQRGAFSRSHFLHRGRSSLLRLELGKVDDLVGHRVHLTGDGQSHLAGDANSLVVEFRALCSGFSASWPPEGRDASTRIASLRTETICWAPLA